MPEHMRWHINGDPKLPVFLYYRDVNTDTLGHNGVDYKRHTICTDYFVHPDAKLPPDDAFLSVAYERQRWNTSAGASTFELVFAAYNYVAGDKPYEDPPGTIRWDKKRKIPIIKITTEVWRHILVEDSSEDTTFSNAANDKTDGFVYGMDVIGRVKDLIDPAGEAEFPKPGISPDDVTSEGKHVVCDNPVVAVAGLLFCKRCHPAVLYTPPSCGSKESS